MSRNVSARARLYHIVGGQPSSQWFYASSWLDMNMSQTWGDEKAIHAAVSRDDAKSGCATWVDPRTGAFTPPAGWPDALLVVEARR